MKKQAAKRGTVGRRTRRVDRGHATPPAPAIASVPLRDRIKELRRVRAAELSPHPLNWRTHPPAQRAALEAMLREIGFANALLARELPDGSLQLIDGHLRAETNPEMEVPVLVLDVDEAEAEKLLATLDPLAAMAAADAQAVAALHARLQTDEADVAQLLEEVRRQAETVQQVIEEYATDDVEAAPLQWQSLFQVIVECVDEQAQQTLFEQLTSQGYKCRALVL